MGKGWTPERRARQSALIGAWQPWAKSTGPRTAEGKAQAAANARAFHGWTPELQAIRAEVRAHTRDLADLLRQQSEALAKLAQVLAGVLEARDFSTDARVHNGQRTTSSAHPMQCLRQPP